MRVARLPGVFRPRSDTWLLAAVLRRQPRLQGGAVLDVCAAGLESAVAERRPGALGPLLAARAPELEAQGLLERGVRREDLLVLAGAA